VQEKEGEERLNSALLGLLHSANQHGNVIRGYIVSIERRCLPAEAFGGMSVAAFANQLVVLSGGFEAISPHQRIASQDGRFPLPMGE
jgi:hypothetical protein